MATITGLSSCGRNRDRTRFTTRTRFHVRGHHLSFANAALRGCLPPAGTPPGSRLSTRTVNTGTLLAFAYHESRLRPFAIHDNTTDQSAFPTSAAEAAGLARVRLAQGHNLDLGIMQVNSGNLARTGLTVTTAFDAGKSMRAGAMILTGAYQRCLHGNTARTTPSNRQPCAAPPPSTTPGTNRPASSMAIRRMSGVPPRRSCRRFSSAPPATSPPRRSRRKTWWRPNRAGLRPRWRTRSTPPRPCRIANDGLSDALHLTKGKDTP